ncbi:flagellar hook-length control protein FliK [Undibacterium oligocarboniphilum]|uniref:Flagellar hook-length control protein FliK n=1 Tax=Undibacterium oligocarboniphilum TaxID=666702 RepID=A0A850QG29_9BURK|nr:flagellar hook-length control protein FliK [Undibacterium oligocarboniphilum]MBC3870267.1 flagellar hook-length control protein FliK [Undibacterium oligocarboniphilum]NVO78258.1 flagellar hook-length control protein FliK [Undibacterium oligocarboniphilum]
MPYRLDNALRPSINIEAPAAIQGLAPIKQEVASKLAQLVVGQQLTGKILSQASPGTFNVNLDGANIQLALPDGLKEGDLVQLRVLSSQPQLTFSLESQTFPSPRLPIPVTLNTAENASIPDKLDSPINIQPDKSHPSILPTAQFVAGSSVITLSDISKLINLIDQQKNPLLQQNGIIAKTPVLNSPDDLKSVSKTAHLLQQQITHSGLFYESHLNEWVDGKRSLNDLQLEPQSQLSTLSAEQASNTNTISSNKELTQLIQQQLHTLENQSVQWHGEIFPGQVMDWIIKKDNQHPSQYGHQEQSIPQWSSVVQFNLPTLGTVSATITLRGQHINFALQAENPETALLLTQQTNNLASSMSVAGAVVDGIQVKRS